MISHEMVGVQKLEYNFGIISTKLQYGMNVGKLEINPNPKWHFLTRYPLTHATVATDELLCLKNAGTQISMFFTSNE